MRRRAISHAARLIAQSVQACVVIVALTPAVLVVALSFSAETFIHFPPRNWGLEQYRNLVASSDWFHAVVISFRVAIPAALLALAIATPAAFAIHRTALPGREWLEFTSLSPLLIPLSAYAVALYGVYLRFNLVGTFWGLVLAHSVMASPLALLIVGAALTRIPRELELVAMSLGASLLRARVGVTCRLLVPALCAGFVFAFLTSFDDAVLVTFLGGPGLTTLSKAIFDSLRFSVDPAITAISAVLMTFTALLIGVSMWLRREQGK